MVLALIAALAGAGLMTATWMMHRRQVQRALQDLLGRKPVSAKQEESLSALARHATELADQAVDRVTRSRSLGPALERAKIPMRPGEFVVVVGGFGLGFCALALAVTHSALLAGLAPIVVAVGAWFLVRVRIARRRRAFEQQLPDALSLIASSLSAGHTFLRAIQMMCEESGPPLSEEFSVVVTQARLGDSLVDSLERMAQRLQVRDLDIIVQAIAIQQSVGGRLADLLHTLSDFIRSRDEVRREVRVLTAEGRVSAYVLTGLVPFLFFMIKVMNPVYAEPLLSGAGLLVLVFSGVSVLVGLVVILKMVTIDF